MSTLRKSPKFFLVPNTKIGLPRILASNTFRRNVAGFLPAILWAILVIILSLTSVAVIPRFSWSDIGGIDKIGHLLFYCILALLIVRGFFGLHQRYKNMIIWTMVICVMFGVSMELLQSLMRSGRQFEYSDILANVVGVLVANCIFNVLLKKKYHGSHGH